ncbi:MAG: hypothetical protein HYY23_13670 [Verrucomicrobia bacterium]|nr:hypothetical protein [Verrucomicrobiota bacterium]
MRTKTLLLTAALSAAGVATSMAQVFSVNAVGYVTTKIPAGKFALISNPLIATDNKVEALFAGLNVQIFKFDSAKGAWNTAQFDDLENKIIGPAAAQEVKPGEGVFVKNLGKTEISVTFVGEVPAGDLSNPLPKGFSVRSSQVPQKGKLKDALGLNGEVGDTIYRWTGDNYKQLLYDDLDNNWTPNDDIEVGEAFFISKKNAGAWTRKFTIN